MFGHTQAYVMDIVFTLFSFAFLMYFISEIRKEKNKI